MRTHTKDEHIELESVRTCRNHSRKRNRIEEESEREIRKNKGEMFDEKLLPFLHLKRICTDVWFSVEFPCINTEITTQNKDGLGIFL